MAEALQILYPRNKGIVAGIHISIVERLIKE